jgi:predicted amidohydrolase
MISRRLTVKIAACQLAPAHDIEVRKAQMHSILLRSEKEQVDLICFPEGFLTGYYVDEVLARENSLKVGESDFDEWLKIAKNYSPTVIVGFNERVGVALFDSAAVIENGKLLGVQRKHYLYHNYFASGTSFRHFQSKGVNFGVVICLDTKYFEPSRILALQGAAILFSPMCNRVSTDHPYAKRPSYYSHFVARSYENQCWLVTADWALLSDGETTCPGRSVIYDPDGKEVARSREGIEDLLLFDIPKERLFREKDQRVCGSPLLSQEIATISSAEPMTGKFLTK